MDNNGEYIELDGITTDLLVEKIKEKTMKKTFKIDITESNFVSVVDSKFGGLPYWDESMEYPTDSNGNALILLAQINFEATPINDERFPKKGILQFFIGTDDLMGADLDNLTNKNGFRVIYHESVNKYLTSEDVRAMGIRSNLDLDGACEEYFPFYKQYSIAIYEALEPISYADHEFEDILRETAEEILDTEIDDVWSIFEDDGDYINDQFYICGNKVLGYPFFTQEDPRDEDDMYKGKKYDTLLLQIDSEGDILWGDSGVGNFFINEQDLINKDFSNVLYTWDCY